MIRTSKDQIKVSPFLKWAGGKRWLIEKHSDIFPLAYNRYFEPFLGSGAVFFYLKPKSGVLSDVNRDLIITYKSVKQKYALVIDKLGKYQHKHSEKFYYKVRTKIENERVAIAARFIYLNRTCWNGLYRENKLGVFNVPKGTKNNVSLSADDFKGVSKLLKKFTLKCQDFELTINLSQAGDFIFVDPPYTVSHNNNGFIKYNQKLFSWDDQIRLKASLDRASDRGVKFIVSNASHVSLKTLYKDYHQQKLQRASALASSYENRRRTEELIIKNF